MNDLLWGQSRAFAVRVACTAFAVKPACVSRRKCLSFRPVCLTLPIGSDRLSQPTVAPRHRLSRDPATRTMTHRGGDLDIVAMGASADETFPKLVRRNAELRPAKVAIREKDYGIWQPYTWREYFEQGRLIALGLPSLHFARG